MRSRKLSPGFAVTSTTIRSESTRVPPVTAERSPPDSRMTGADSPVMADSSTLAIPSTTSPSAGMTSPAETTTLSPSRSDRGASSTSPSGSGDARSSPTRAAQRLGLGLAPPFGHRLGEVREQHREPEPDGDQAGEDVGSATTKSR